jgi:hypothetical protein
MKQSIFTLAAVLVLTGQAWAGTWIEVSSGPGRITTYNGGGRFDAKLYDSQSSTTPLSSLLVTCVDFLNLFSYGNRWEVNFTKIDGTQSLANTRYGGATNLGGAADRFDNYSTQYNALDRYRMAAWLTSQLPNYLGDRLERQGIQGAIWYLLDPVGTPNAPISSTTGFLTSRSSWLNQAITTGLSQDASFYSQYRVVTQVGVSWLGDGVRTRYQEFITTVTPEPGTWAALAVALGAVLYFARRRQAATAA